MTNPELDGAGDNDQSKLDAELTSKTTTVDLENGDDSKAQLINANGGAGTDVRYEGTAASSDGEVSFNGLGKEEVMRYADEPFWKRLRVILLVIFWLGWLAMLATAVIIIALAPRCPPRPDNKWYQKETVYQVIPESFYDGSGDGIGDFDGLKTKMDYITSLGVNAVWLNKIFKTSDDWSELAIMDHKELNERFGTTPAAFQAWIKSLQKDSKKVILDLIINQVSEEHDWFKKSIAKEGKYANYFIWKQSAGVPNNWKSQDGSPGWTEDTVRGEWYYHAFGPNYPDLNLNNTDVVDEIKEIMNFWFSSGVSGFHIKDVEFLVEQPDLADDGNKHTEETLYLLEELRAVADSFSLKPGRERFLFGTTYSATANQTADLWGKSNKRRLHMVLPVMEFFDKDTDANKIKEEISGYLSDTGYQWLGLALGNQYVPRIASRLETATHKMIPAIALEMLLPGTPFNYYGDEFGQLNGVTSNPMTGIMTTPMQWNNQDNAGFCMKGAEYTAKDQTKKIWIDQHGSPAPTYKTNNLKASQTHFSSVMSPFQAFGRLLLLRGEESFQWGKTQVCAINKDLLTIKREAYRFPGFVVMMNVGKTEMNFDLSTRTDCVGSKPMATVRFHSSMADQVGETLDFHTRPVVLRSGDVVVLEYEAEEP